MLTIELVILGKLKEIFWQKAEQEYITRLKPLAKIIIRELKEEGFDEKSSKELIKKKEAEKIKNTLKKIKNAFIIVLDEYGTQFDSSALAQKIQLISHVHSTVVFIIGGPLGLDSSILGLSNLKLSLSALTFTHQMARIILLEQLYRGFMINANRRYHY